MSFCRIQVRVRTDDGTEHLSKLTEHDGGSTEHVQELADEFAELLGEWEPGSAGHFTLDTELGAVVMPLYRVVSVEIVDRSR